MTDTLNIVFGCQPSVETPTGTFQGGWVLAEKEEQLYRVVAVSGDPVFPALACGSLGKLL